VLRRYANAAREVEPGLCCPSERYEPSLLANLPAEIVAKDYGCGDPSKYVQAGDSVVDLGAGSGKACFLIAQRVGSGGSVIGVDFNDSMLNLARRYEPEIAERVGFSNVRFVKARIQDMALDLEKAEELLRNQPPEWSSSG
jgi:SAM-dependent methyltransferase